MRRLYVQIYLTLIGVLLLSTMLGWLTWAVFPPPRHESRLYEQIGEVLTEILPRAEAR